MLTCQPFHTLKGWAPGSRIESPDAVTSPGLAICRLSPLAGQRNARFAFLSCELRPFPWAEVQCLGLQRYSRLLYLSRGKHYMLYSLAMTGLIRDPGQVFHIAFTSLRRV